jgi:hypothetical protein
MTRPEVTAGPIERARRLETEPEADWGLDGEGPDWEGLAREKMLGIAATHRTNVSTVARVIRVSSDREKIRGRCYSWNLTQSHRRHLPPTT